MSCHCVTGIAYLGGVCSAKRKCVLAEDNGLNLAFTIAHELGHKYVSLCSSLKKVSLDYVSHYYAAFCWENCVNVQRVEEYSAGY